MALVDDIQILAFHDVFVDDQEYRLRHLQRWYSRRFHTPLHLVPTLPLADILQAFWEVHYEEMDDTDRAEERQRLIETREARSARLAQEARDSQATESLLAQMGEEAKTTKKIVDLKIPEQVPVKTRERIPEVGLPSVPPPDLPERLPENISMKFEAPNFFDDLMDSIDDQGGPSDGKGGKGKQSSS